MNECSWYASCFSSVNQIEKAVSASILVHLTILKPLSAHPGVGSSLPQPYAMTSSFHSVVTVALEKSRICFLAKKLLGYS